ncbi:DUF4382 domain-containing protein [Cupriavidus basilensis]
MVPTGGTEQALLDTPSAVQSGIKINRPFTVAANTLSDLVLDFDACKSVVHARQRDLWPQAGGDRGADSG